MSLLTARTNGLGADLVGSLSATTPARVLDKNGPVVTATPVAVGVGITAAVTAGIIGYLAEEAADR